MSIITLDIDNNSSIRSTIEVKQDDTKDITLLLYKNNREFDITGFDVTINGLNSNGDGIVQTTGIAISNGNHIDVVLSNKFTLVPGEVKLEAVLTKEDVRITTFTFKMTVLKGLLKNANMKPTLVIDNIELLTNLIAEAKSLLNK